MAQPHVLILRAPGTNCDKETAFAFAQAGASTQILHINRLLESPPILDDFQILCFPGGFSYGDDVAAGRILATQIQHHLADQLANFKAAGKLILGICNGFQILIKSGILLDHDPQTGPPATLTWNDSGRYEDRWVQLGADSTKCVFLAGIHSMYLPVAHAEGKFVARNPQTLHDLEAQSQVVLRYLAQSSQRPTQGDPPSSPPIATSYPDNPNGSMGAVAGVCDTTGRVLGLMPHPERYIDPTQHPHWTRTDPGPAGEGLQLFTNAVQYFV